jgi:hypothetical protein
MLRRAAAACRGERRRHLHAERAAAVRATARDARDVAAPVRMKRQPAAPHKRATLSTYTVRHRRAAEQAAACCCDARVVPIAPPVRIAQSAAPSFLPDTRSDRGCGARARSPAPAASAAPAMALRTPSQWGSPGYDDGGASSSALFVATERSAMADAQLQRDARVESLQRRWAEVRALSRRACPRMRCAADLTARVRRWQAPSTTGCKTRCCSCPSAGPCWTATRAWTCVLRRARG